MKNYLDVQNCYNRFDRSQNYGQVLIREGYGLQGSEINEIQSRQQDDLKAIADAILRDGDIISDATVVVNAETGAVRCAAGKIYVKGKIRDVSEAVFTIPVTGSVSIGVRPICTVATVAPQAIMM